MKTTIEIPEKIFRQAKARAALEGLSLRELVLRGLQMALEVPPGQSPRQRVSFPIVRAVPGARRLTDEMVRAALDSDEDLA
jgi:hypothetical protein